MRLDEYAFGIRHDSPGLRVPQMMEGNKARHGDPALQWLLDIMPKTLHT